MNRSAASSSALLILLSLALPVGAQGDEPHLLLIRSGAAPVLDGKLGEEEWRGSAHFTMRHGEDVLGKGCLRRHDRDLYLAFSSELPAFGTNLRAVISDPATGRRVLINVTPLSPPLPPLLVHRQRADGQTERGSSSPCAVRFDLSAAGYYTMELRVPLSELEIGRSAKDYAFSLQVWAMEESRALGAFPAESKGGTGAEGAAILRSEPDWGVEIPAADPESNAALALLEDLWRESQWEQIGRKGPAPVQVLVPYLGVNDGKRREGPLRELDAKLIRLMGQFPDYASLRAQLIRVRIGLNDLDSALAILGELADAHPLLAKSPQQLMLQSRTLRDLGRFEEALRVCVENEALLQAMPDFDSTRAGLVSLVEATAVEQGYRAAEAARDDLPRVLFKTGKGEIVFELFEDDAPNAVANFLDLVSSGFYDGTRFHWVEAGGQVIGGDPNSRNADPKDDGFGGPGYMIETETGRRSHLPYTLGFVDKVRTRRTEGSAFIIPIAPMPMLDGVNTVLGRVLSGHDVIRRLEYYDTLTQATILRKRPHPYRPVRRP
ncbi:MAG: peptidylprolyl isomerase [Planctomycetaceae bacterium]